MKAIKRLAPTICLFLVSVGFFACAASDLEKARKDIDQAAKLLSTVGSVAAQIPLCPVPTASASGSAR